MWLAHALTLSRIPLALALGWTWGDRGWAIALIALAAATDAADGNVARWMQRRGHTEPAIGGWLDPLVDKLFVAIVVVVIWSHTRQVAILALVGARELLLAPLFALYLARRRPTSQLHADPIGKAATIAQFVALALIVAQVPWAIAVAALAAALGVASVAHYIARELRSSPDTSPRTPPASSRRPGPPADSVPTDPGG